MPQQLQEFSIPIPEGVRYLSEIDLFQEKGLPSNCLFDKGKTGCGGTTIALAPEQGDYVIAVPFIALILNKTRDNAKILGVYGEVTEAQIKAYHESHEVRKYLVTYESLERLMETVDVTSFKLLVDEYHILFTQYGTVDRLFRKKGAQKVLRNYHRFAEYCFMSATPLEDDFILEEVKELPKVTACWEDVDPVTVQSVLCDDVHATVCAAIRRFLTGEIDGNAYFFVNSVERIKFYIEKVGLTEENTRALYSLSNKTNIGIERSDINSEPKKINFLTSAAFEGVDLFDEDGMIFIVSDSQSPHKIIDISTSFMQISGRIRNALRYKDLVVHFYNKTRYSEDVTYEDYKKACEDEIAQCQEDAEAINGLRDGLRARLEIQGGNGYLSKNEENRFECDANLLKVDLYQFKLTRLLYSSSRSLHEAYSQRDFNITQLFSKKKFDIVEESEKRMTFREKVLFLKGMRVGIPEKYGYEDPEWHEKEYEKWEKVEEILRHETMIKKAIYLPQIGYDGIERLNYNPQEVQRKIIQIEPMNDAKKIAVVLKEQGLEERFYSNAELKKVIQDAYDYLAVGAKAKASDILKFYRVKGDKNQQVRKNGKRVKGYIVVRRRTDL